MVDSYGNGTGNPNPPYGEKGSFRKVTITLPPEAYENLVRESARRKIAGEPNHLLSAMLREAVTLYFAAIENMNVNPGESNEEGGGNHSAL
jgi:hypothetical protein